jgi:predicted RNA methylase
MLSIGAAMLGSLHVIAIDIDEDALHTAQSNCEQFEGLQVALCQA